MDDPILDYRRPNSRPGPYQEWPQATLALLMGVASGPASLACLCTGMFQGWWMLLALVPLLGTVVYSAVVLSHVIRAGALSRARNESICGVVLPFLWPFVIYLLVRLAMGNPF